jgi:phage baseplate assembly protein W
MSNSPNLANPNPYGYDMNVVADATPDMADVGGLTVLVNALARRLATPRGGLIDDPNYGYSLEQHINSEIRSAASIARIAANIDAEFQKDPRVYASNTQATFFGTVLTTVSTIRPSAGPSFTLVLSVGALNTAGVQILSVSPTT